MVFVTVTIEFYFKPNLINLLLSNKHLTLIEYMETGLSVKILYWSEQTGPQEIMEFVGIDEFKETLSDHYVSLVQNRPGDLGGLYHMVVEFVSQMTFQRVTEIIIEGIAFDLIKEGSKAFVLKPFLNAYRELLAKPENERLDIEELTIAFQDTTLHIDQVGNEIIVDNLENIFTVLSHHYENLTLANGERPVEIYLPVFEDPADGRLSKFRVRLDVDETIFDFSAANYTTYWGI